MEKSEKKTKKKEEDKPKEEEKEKEKGGFPKDVDFKRFLGCGG